MDTIAGVETDLGACDWVRLGIESSIAKSETVGEIERLLKAAFLAE
jgi:hypothetical protein